MLETFIAVHDQDIIIQAEKNNLFRNAKNYKWLFLGKRPVDKLAKYKHKVIIARDLPDNIEGEKCLFDYTGWYAVAKNNLIKGEYTSFVQYDCYLKDNYGREIRKTLKEYKDCFIGFQPHNLDCNYFISDNYSKAIKKAILKVYNIDVEKLVEDAILAGDPFWAGGSTFVCTKKWLNDYINWFEAIKPEIIDDKMAAHNSERGIKLFCLINGVHDVYLPQVMEHIFNCDHDQVYLTEEVHKRTRKRYNKFIKGELFAEERQKRIKCFLQTIFSAKNQGTRKVITILGIKIKIRRGV